PAVQEVGALAPIEHVIPAESTQRVVTSQAFQRVVSCTALQAVITARAHEMLVAAGVTATAVEDTDVSCRQRGAGLKRGDKQRRAGARAVRVGGQLARRGVVAQAVVGILAGGEAGPAAEARVARRELSLGPEGGERGAIEVQAIPAGGEVVQLVCISRPIF